MILFFATIDFFCVMGYALWVMTFERGGEEYNSIHLLNYIYVSEVNEVNIKNWDGSKWLKGRWVNENKVGIDHLGRRHRVLFFQNNNNTLVWGSELKWWQKLIIISPPVSLPLVIISANWNNLLLSSELSPATTHMGSCSWDTTSIRFFMNTHPSFILLYYFYLSLGPIYLILLVFILLVLIVVFTSWSPVVSVWHIKMMSIRVPPSTPNLPFPSG